MDFIFLNIKNAKVWLIIPLNEAKFIIITGIGSSQDNNVQETQGPVSLYTNNHALVRIFFSNWLNIWSGLDIFDFLIIC